MMMFQIVPVKKWYAVRMRQRELELDQIREQRRAA